MNYAEDPVTLAASLVEETARALRARDTVAAAKAWAAAAAELGIVEAHNRQEDFGTAWIETLDIARRAEALHIFRVTKLRAIKFGHDAEAAAQLAAEQVAADLQMLRLAPGYWEAADVRNGLAWGYVLTPEAEGHARALMAVGDQSREAVIEECLASAADAVAAMQSP